MTEKLFEASSSTRVLVVHWSSLKLVKLRNALAMQMEQLETAMVWDKMLAMVFFKKEQITLLLLSVVMKIKKVQQLH